MINNINGYSSLFNTDTSSTTSTVEDAINTITQSESATETTESEALSNLYLSNRSQKINAFSTEFFGNGDININEVSALKERAYQLGLISKEEYARLTDTELSENDMMVNRKMSGETLASFSENFIQRLDVEIAADENSSEEDLNDSNATETDTEREAAKAHILTTLNNLKSALTAAKSILENVESAKSDENFKETLSNTLSSLKETISSDAFEFMPMDDKVGISKVYQALEIVDKISPQRLNNTKVDRYIQFSID